MALSLRQILLRLLGLALLFFAIFFYFNPPDMTVAAQYSADWLGGIMPPVIRIFLWLAAIFGGFYYFLWGKITVPMFKPKDGKANPAGIVFAVIVVIAVLVGLSK